MNIGEKEVQDTSCRGVWGCPPDLKIPQDWGIRGLIETILAVSLQLEAEKAALLQQKWKPYLIKEGFHCLRRRFLVE